MKVLVLEPPNQLLPIDTARPNGALGPAYLVGALRARGIEADYLDATVGRPTDGLAATYHNRVEQDNGTIRYGASPELLARIFAGYDVVATSSIFTAQTRMHFEAAHIAKRVSQEGDRKILVISGGVNARALHRHFLANGFDVVALGEGERTIVEIVQEYGRPTPDFSRIRGVAFGGADGPVVSPAGVGAARSGLDELPPPALDALPLGTYRDLGIPHAGVLPRGRMFAPIQTSRGCQDRCTFCHISVEKLTPDLVGRVGFLREFSKARVAQDVDQAVTLGVNQLYFEDDNLFFNKRRLIELAPILVRRGLEYSNVNGANLRFLLKRTRDGSYMVDTEFIETLAGFGLRELVLPFESRSAEMMRRYASGKYDPDVMDSVALVRALKGVGIRTSGNFMIGFPDESWESVLQTKEFARELVAEGLDDVGFMIPVPYPGSLDFETLMHNQPLRIEFDRDPLRFTDHMHFRARPLYPTAVPGDRLQAAVHEFWVELNDGRYVAQKLAQNVEASSSGAHGGPGNGTVGISS